MFRPVEPIKARSSLPSQSLLQRMLRRTALLLRRRVPLCRRSSCHSNTCRTRNNSFCMSVRRSDFSTYGPYSTTAMSHQSAAVMASTFDDDDDNESTEDRVIEEESRDVERILRDSMNHFLPHAAPPYSSRLELELGELREHNTKSIWDDNMVDDYIEEDDEEFGKIVEQIAAENLAENVLPPMPPTPPPAASSQSEPTRRKSVRELLANFDPDHEPIVFSDGDRDKQLEELQLWLECSAQVEALIKNQEVLDAARERKDYTSISAVQRNMMKWFDDLQKAIEEEQHRFLFSDVSVKGAKSTKQFGPYICTLPAGKLALLTSNVAIIQTIVQVGKSELSQHGCPLVRMVDKIGRAVEEEVVIHRLLHKRFEESKKERKRARESDSNFDSDQDGDEGKTTPDPIFESKAIEKGIATFTHRWSYAASHLNRYLDELSRSRPARRNRTEYAVRKARSALESEEEWDKGKRVQLGAALFKCILDTATVTTESGKEEPAFFLEKKYIAQNKRMGFVKMNDRLYHMITSDRMESLAATSTRHKPMVVPPRPWTKIREGGYHVLKVDIMRHHGCQTQQEALTKANCSTVFEGLNALGRVPWRINQPILEVAWRCWKENIPLGDIPSQTDLEVPEVPMRPAWPAGVEKGTSLFDEHIKEYRSYVDLQQRYNRVLQKNMDLRSLRFSAELKLDQAEKFKEFDKIYFPYNMDFRGRAYPIPPHLSNVGSDLCRGVLMFAEPKPLGERGLYWLKVHLANFAGADKLKFEARASFVDEHMDQVRESVRDPFAGERWWMSLEDPFQGLATAREIVSAIDSGDPSSYMCALPVHMDGSCNGLQHYAALGRDYVGGKAVNLCVMDEPQDVYVGVMHEVIRRVAEEAARDLDFDTSDVNVLKPKQRTQFKVNRAAKLVDGLIDRGVVKRTVMTSVYGVTLVGAREQIREKIAVKLVSKGHDIDEIDREVYRACGYLAGVTMDVIGELFTGAKETMHWLTKCARMITQHGYPVAWVSPIGLPAIQPYRQKRIATLVTLLQKLSLTKDSDELPIHRSRQATAFPPNYIHSLDSSHMLLTALEMDRRGLTFSAVHDSFWTHACDVDEMNTALRDVFVDLYSQPLLERLKESWEKRYPDLEFPDLPNRGSLDLEEVRQSKYFFQ